MASDLGDSYAVILHEPANYLRSHRRQSGYRALLARHNFSTPARFHLRMQFVQLVNSVFSSRFLNVEESAERADFGDSRFYTTTMYHRSYHRSCT